VKHLHDAHVCCSLDILYKMLYNSYMEQERYQVLRIWKQTHHTLRKIAAETGESLVEALERMANEEWQRLQQRTDRKREERATP
jgi:hypothetical protein